MSTWNSVPQPEPPGYGPLNCCRFLCRWLLMAAVIYGLLAVMLAVRAFEWPWGRPVSPRITQLACRLCLKIIGLKLRIKGAPMPAQGAVVSNHVSWLDIFVSNSAQRIVFVSKSEVADWTGIGFLAKATGAVFVKRDPRQALRQRDEFIRRISRGERLLFFPEGTSTDGLRVLPFKPTLFAALFSAGVKDSLKVQPVTIRYRPRPEQNPAFYGFWGDAGFGASLFKVLSEPRNGEADLIFHDPVRASDFADRKQLAAYCEKKVREGLAAAD